METELETLREDAKTLAESKKSELAEVEERKKSELAALEAKYAEDERLYEDLKKEHTALKNMLEETMAAKEKSEKATEDLAKQVEQMASSLSVFQEAASGNSEDAKAVVARLQLQVNELQTRLASSHQSEEEYRRKWETLQEFSVDELQRAQARIDELTATCGQLVQQVEDANNGKNMTALLEELEGLKLEKEMLMTQVQEVQNQYEATVDVVSNSSNIAIERENKLDEMKEKVSSLEKQLEEKTQREKELEKELSTTKATSAATIEQLEASGEAQKKELTQLKRRTLALKNMEENMKDVEDLLQQREKQLKDVLERIKKADRRSDEATKEAAQYRSENEQLRHQMENYHFREGEAGEVLEKVVEVQVDKPETLQRLSACGSEIEELKAKIASLEESLEKKRQEEEAAKRATEAVHAAKPLPLKFFPLYPELEAVEEETECLHGARLEPVEFEEGVEREPVKKSEMRNPDVVRREEAERKRKEEEERKRREEEERKRREEEERKRKEEEERKRKEEEERKRKEEEERKRREEEERKRREEEERKRREEEERKKQEEQSQSTQEQIPASSNPFAEPEASVVPENPSSEKETNPFDEPESSEPVTNPFAETESPAEEPAASNPFAESQSNPFDEPKSNPFNDHQSNPFDDHQSNPFDEPAATSNEAPEPAPTTPLNPFAIETHEDDLPAGNPFAEPEKPVEPTPAPVNPFDEPASEVPTQPAEAEKPEQTTSVNPFDATEPEETMASNPFEAVESEKSKRSLWKSLSSRKKDEEKPRNKLMGGVGRFQSMLKTAAAMGQSAFAKKSEEPEHFPDVNTEELQRGMASKPVEYFFKNWHCAEEEKKHVFEWVKAVVDNEMKDNVSEVTVEKASMFVGEEVELRGRRKRRSGRV